MSLGYIELFTLSLHMQAKSEDLLTETCIAMLFLVLANFLNVPASTVTV